MTNRDGRGAADATDTGSDDSAEGLYKAYEEYAKALRTWLVAYGIGGPAFLLANESVRRAIAASGQAETLGALFLVGVALQVLLAAVNKTVMWACYFSELHPEVQDFRRYRFFRWMAEQFWIDFGIDLLSLILFGRATLLSFQLLTRIT